MGLITAGYTVLVALSGVFVAAGCLIPAIIVGVAALALALRYEIRWTLDHTPLTQHTPRPVPKRPINSLRN